jgi:hypothetical protein
LKDLIPRFLATFAPHADPKDQQICKFREQLFRLSIRTSLSFITSSIGAIGMGVAGPLANQAFSSFMGEFTDALIGSGGVLDVQKTFEPKKITMDSINDNFKALPGGTGNIAYDLVAGEIKSFIMEEFFDGIFPPQDTFQASGSWMEEGINKNSFCGDLDVADSQHPQNIIKIQEGMGTYFEYLRDTAVESYGKLYKGKFPPVNNQSALASLFATLKWTGDDKDSESIEGAIAHAEKWKL